jgi:hypothetical protein
MTDLTTAVRLVNCPPIPPVHVYYYNNIGVADICRCHFLMSDSMNMAVADAVVMTPSHEYHIIRPVPL